MCIRDSNYLGGGAGAADFGSLQHLGVGFFVMLVILIAKQMKGFINDISILIGIVAGYLLAIALGMVDFQPVAEAAWISLPQFLPVMPTFHMEAILAMGIMFVATAVETIGKDVYKRQAWRSLMRSFSGCMKTIISI